jgi:perosamine synthetase
VIDSSPLPYRRVSIGTADITADDKRRVADVLDSGRLSAGPMIAEFEKQFAALHGCRQAAMCNSGTGALQLAVQVLKERNRWPDGSEVLVPAMTFVATINIVLFNRLTPVLVDIDPLTFTMDPTAMDAAITERTVAVLPVHLFGQPADMSSIMAIASSRHLRVVEDSAETAFVSHQGRPVGSFGDFGCFSTYMAHLVTTGVGGLALTNDDDNALRFRSLMNHGRNPRYLTIDDDEVTEDDELLRVVWSRYEFTSIGQSFRVTEMEAALGIGQLARHESMLARRQATAARLFAALASPDLQLPTIAHGNEHAFMMFPIVCRRPGLRDPLVRALERSGVETRFLLPIIGQPCYRTVLDAAPKDYPAAQHALDNGFYIGCHQHMTADDVAHVATVVHAVMASK